MGREAQFTVTEVEENGEGSPLMNHDAKRKGCCSSLNLTFIVLLIVATIGLGLVAVGNAAMTIVTMPGQIVLSVLGGLMVILASEELIRRWYNAKPNEWLLVIENGRLKSAGIGMSVFRGLTQSIVKFPSSIQEVSFGAQQVTREMQGVEVNGFVIWVINRNGEGPFKAYKYLDGLCENGMKKATKNIKSMAESIMRHQIANLTINEVLTNRKLIRDKCRDEMLEVVKGWGIWLETVEITDVKILSRKLFEDLQQPFRQETHLMAETVSLGTDQQLHQRRQEHSLETTLLEEETRTKKSSFSVRHQLMREQEEEKLLAERQRVKIAFLAKEKEMDVIKVSNEAAVKEEELKHNLELEQRKSDALVARRRSEANTETEILRQRIEAENTMTAASVAKLQIEAAREVYPKLQTDAVRVLHIDGGSGKSQMGLESLLPGLAAVSQTLQLQKH